MLGRLQSPGLGIHGWGPLLAQAVTVHLAVTLAAHSAFTRMTELGPRPSQQLWENLNPRPCCKGRGGDKHPPWHSPTPDNSVAPPLAGQRIPTGGLSPRCWELHGCLLQARPWGIHMWLATCSVTGAGS